MVSPKRKSLKKRVIQKRKGSKQEVTEILTTEEEGQSPQTNVTVKEIDVPEEVSETKPTFIVEEFPEEVITEILTVDGKPRKRSTKKRVIQKRRGSKIEITQLVTIEEDGKKPETTVTIEETDSLEENYGAAPLQEMPEEVFIIEKDGEDGKRKKKVIKKKTFKKRKGDKQEITQIVTVEEEGKPPETSITVEEGATTQSVCGIPVKSPTYIEELPEEVFETTITKDGKPKKRLIRKRMLQKRKGDKVEITKIETVEDEGTKPETTVTVEEIQLTEEVTDIKPEQFEIQELPEQILVTETLTEDGKPKKQVIKKRIIQKRKGAKQETTQIVTVEEEGKEPLSTVTTEETDLLTEMPEESHVEELPEQISIDTKRKGNKQETTQIVTLEEEGKLPETSITLEEVELPEIEKQRKPRKKTKKATAEPEEKILFVPTLAQEKELPTEEEVLKLLKLEIIRKILSHPLAELPIEFDFPLEQCAILHEMPETIDTVDLPDGTKTTVKKRAIKKDKGSKDEIITIFIPGKTDVNQLPTVTIEEYRKPTEEVYPLVPIIELPEDIEVIEISTTEETPKKKITKKRTLLKKVGPKVEVTEILTVLEDDKEPQQSVRIKEYPETTTKKKRKPKDKDSKDIPVAKKPLKKEIAEMVEVKPTKNKPKEVKFPKVRLASRIRHLTFPPESEKETNAVIKILPPYIKDHGTLSRNIAEATETLKKKKHKKFKDIDRDLPDLDKLDEFEEPEKPKKETVDEEFKYKKKPKQPKGKDNEQNKIILGKGKLPEEGELPESVKLKGIPKKIEDQEPTIIKKPKVESKDDQKTKDEKPEDEKEPIEFKPYDIDRDDYDLDKLERREPESKEKPKKGKSGKYLRKPKSKKEPETEELTLQPGIPKKEPVDEAEDKKYKKKQKQLPEEPKEDIKLKPFKKPDTENEIHRVGESLDRPKTLGTQVYELPEEIIEVTETTPDGKPTKKTIKKRVIKKKHGPVQEITTIETITPEEGTTEVIMKVEEVPHDDVQPSEAQEVFETPEETEEIEEKIGDVVIQKKIKKRILKKRKGDKIETTKILTVLEEDKEPQTTITVYTEDKPEDYTGFELIKPTKPKAVTIELPEEVKVTKGLKKGKPISKTVKKRTIKKLSKPKQEVIEIETVEEAGKKPETTVRIEEVQDTEYPLKGATIIVEQPEIVETVKEVVDGVVKEKKVRKRVIKKNLGDKTETTVISETEENGKPVYSVKVTMSEIESIYTEDIEPLVVEYPEVQTTPKTVKSLKTVKTRKIKKYIGPKQEITHIQTIEEEGKEPVSTVTIDEEENVFQSPKMDDVTRIIETPEQIYTLENIENGEIKTKLIKKKQLKKKLGNKQEITEIITTEEDDKQPQSYVNVFTTDLDEFEEESIIPTDFAFKITAITPKITPHTATKTITEVHTLEHTQDTTVGPLIPKMTHVQGTLVQDIKESIIVEAVETQKPVDQVPEKHVVEELPEEIEVIKTLSVDGKPKQKIVKKRVIKKQKGDKLEKTEILTVEEEGEKPKSTVVVEEILLNEAVLDDIPKLKPEYSKFIEELPEEVTVTQVETKEGPKKQVTRKRVIKKLKGGKQESTVIVTVEEEGKKPVSTVTIEEEEFPEEVVAVKPEQPVVIEELPEEVIITEVKTEEGPKKRTTKKRIIRKRTGTKQESTEIVTVEEEGKKPVTTITVEESVLPEEDLKELSVIPQETFIEELPEEIKVTEIETREGPKKQTLKKRVIRKRKGSKEESTEIITVEEEGKQPQMTVSIKETELPTETVEPIEFTSIKQEPTYIEELPEEVIVTHVETEEGPKKSN
ncbi:hypothetical protein NQ318_016822 [Aromia moschata]|uniref:Titin n=1 Tax=Aromia moschata TaxID=1265417 RepID=A0AAV8YVA9_9CUCU|nr:hypothetical protein NQ318_016822 [Aromia moschata]